MRFNRLDLNLLVARSTPCSPSAASCRAAERLNLSPRATSNALARLRDYFGDELLVQVGRRMEPTPRAPRPCANPCATCWCGWTATIAVPPDFDATASSDREFRIFVSDYSQMVTLAPHLLALAQPAARCIARLRLPAAGQATRSAALERGEADLLVIPRGLLSPKTIRRTRCTTERLRLHGLARQGRHAQRPN
jgi:LysR family nod box-dependent transcriptional activator